MTMNYTDEIRKLAKEILSASSQPYTDDQLKEIPRILNTKARYFWGVDLMDYDALRDALTPDMVSFWNGWAGPASREEQVASAIKSTGQGDMIPMHFGHNQIVQFLDDTHARLMTRMNDYHTYTDNGETYAGFGLYIDDLRKCSDGVWRIEVLRLDYGVTLGELRSQKKS